MKNRSTTIDYGNSKAYPVAQKQQEGNMNKMTKGQWLGSWGFIIGGIVGMLIFVIALFDSRFMVVILIGGILTFKSGYDSLKKYRLEAKRRDGPDL